MSALELLQGFLEAPGETARGVSARPPVVLGTAAYLIAGLSLFLAQALSGSSFFLGISSISLSIACVSRLALGFAMSAALHMLCEGLGGRGKALPLFVLLGLSDMGWALALPGALVLRALLPEARWAATVLFFAVGFVTLTLKARSLEHNYGMSSSKAWLALSLPYLGLMALVFGTFMVALAGTLHQLVKMFS